MADNIWALSTNSVAKLQSAVINGNKVFNGPVEFQAPVWISNTNNSSSTSTGCLTTVGGIGVGGNLSVGGKILQTIGGGGIAIGSSNTYGGAANAGTYNICIGDNAGNAITSTATGHVFIGQGAGSGVTTALNNVYIGQNAGAGNSTGGLNVIVGGCTTAPSIGAGTNACTIIGVDTGTSVLTGNGNTILGAQTAGALTSGTTNTIIGRNCANTLATGSNNIIIGNLAGNGMGTGASGCIEITNFQHSNSLSNVMILGQPALTESRLWGSAATRFVANGATVNLLAYNSYLNDSTAVAATTVNVFNATTAAINIGGGSALTTIGSAQTTVNKLNCIQTGAAAATGTATLNQTTAVVVNTSAVTANSTICLSYAVPAGTAIGGYYVSAISAGNSFSLKSTAADTSTVNWVIIN